MHISISYLWRPRKLLIPASMLLLKLLLSGQLALGSTIVFTYTYDANSQLKTIHATTGNKAEYTYDPAGNHLGVTATIIPSSIGDYNRDGVVDLLDVILSLKAVSGKSTEAFDLAADTNTDGKIGVADTIYVLKALAQ